MPAFVGPCKKSLKRWTFDGKTCLQFRYGGCHGNGNKFLTKEMCKKACMKQSTTEETPTRPQNGNI